MLKMTKEKALQLVEQAKDYDMNIHGKVMKSDAAYMVLELMDTEEFGNNYCASLNYVTNTFPEIDIDELDVELNRYI